MSQDEHEYEDEEFDNQDYEGPDSDIDEDDPDYEGSYNDDFDDEEDSDGEGVEGDFYDNGSDSGQHDDQDAYFPSSDNNNDDRPRRNRYRDEIYSKRVPAGKRTYFFDVKTTRSGKDFFLTITESKKVGENRYEKHKLFLYKEDFGKFVSAMHEVVDYVKEECLPDYEFRGLPEVSNPGGEQEDDWSEEEGSY